MYTLKEKDKVNAYARNSFTDNILLMQHYNFDGTWIDKYCHVQLDLYKIRLEKFLNEETLAS